MDKNIIKSVWRHKDIKVVFSEPSIQTWEYVVEAKTKNDILHYYYTIEKRRAVSISDVNKRIQELEELYQKYDLIHNFVRLFGMPDTREEQKELIRKKKKEVSDMLTEVLKTKQLKRRQCPDCGMALPYNYQYGICEICYSMRNRGYGYWGDEWFSDNKSKKEHAN